MNRIRKFLISYLSIIFVLFVFLILNVFSIFVEHFLGKIDIETAWKVRLWSIVFELMVVGTGILMKFQKKLRRSRFLNILLDSFGVESLPWKYRWMDSIAVFFCIYLAYVGRLAYFCFGSHEVSLQSFFLGSTLALLGVFLFGYVKKIVRYGKQRIRRYHTVKK